MCQWGANSHNYVCGTWTLLHCNAAGRPLITGSYTPGMSIAGRYGLSYHCGGGLSLFATFGLVTQALALVSPDLRDEVALAPFMLAMISHEEAFASLDSALRLQPFTHRVVGHALIFPPLPGICQGPTRPVTNVTIADR